MDGSVFEQVAEAALFLVRQSFQRRFRLGLNVQNPFNRLIRECAIARGALQRGHQVLQVVVSAQRQDFSSLSPPLSMCFQQFLEEPLADHSQLDKALT